MVVGKHQFFHNTHYGLLIQNAFTVLDPFSLLRFTVEFTLYVKELMKIHDQCKK